MNRIRSFIKFLNTDLVFSPVQTSMIHTISIPKMTASLRLPKYLFPDNLATINENPKLDHFCLLINLKFISGKWGISEVLE